MKFRLIIDKEKDEEVVATVHHRSPLIDEIEALISKHTDRIPGYMDDEIKMLAVAEIECITVLDGKTYAIDSDNRRYRLKGRLYELEAQLGNREFVRISNSEIINLKKVRNFDLSLSGTICVTLSDGTATYVSRRYVSKIKKVLGL